MSQESHIDIEAELESLEAHPAHVDATVIERLHYLSAEESVRAARRSDCEAAGRAYGALARIESVAHSKEDVDRIHLLRRRVEAGRWVLANCDAVVDGAALAAEVRREIELQWGDDVDQAVAWSKAWRDAPTNAGDESTYLRRLRAVKNLLNAVAASSELPALTCGDDVIERWLAVRLELI